MSFQRTILISALLGLLAAGLAWWLGHKEKIAYNTVFHTGAMRAMRMEGKTTATLDLDTLKPLTGLYALGPVENLQGEITVYDGKAYFSQVGNEGQEIVKTEAKGLKAIFSAYAWVKGWKEASVGQTGRAELTIMQDIIGNAAFKAGIDTSQAFPILIKVPKGRADYHIVQPTDSMGDGRMPRHKNFIYSAGPMLLTGFYSRHHQGVFTHQGNFLHLHFLSGDRKHMGHLDYLHFSWDDVKLFLPAPVK